MSNTIKSGVVSSYVTQTGIDRNWQDTQAEAVNILSQYCNVETLAPAFSVDPTERIRAYATANNVPISGALRKFRETLKSLACDEATRQDDGRVSLDVDGHFGGRLWSLPTAPVTDDSEGGPIPQIVFCSLRTTSAMYVPGKCEAIAVYYLPPARDIHRVSGNTGLPYSMCDNFDPAGYLGVVGTYGDLDAADEHRALLQWAVRLIATPPPSDQEDELTDDDDEVSDGWTVADARRVERSAEII